LPLPRGHSPKPSSLLSRDALRSLVAISKQREWPACLALASSCHDAASRSTPLHLLALSPDSDPRHTAALVSMLTHAPDARIQQRLIDRKV
ncbi:hypothetical protein ABTP39_19195, partial [Acinetobacter baumannii]